jgi:hypothetical protein
MCVQVDQAGRDQLSGAVDDLGGGAGQRGTHRGDAAGPDRDVEPAPVPAAGIDEVTAGEEQIHLVRHGPPEIVGGR